MPWEGCAFVTILGNFIFIFMIINRKQFHIKKTCLYNFDPLKPHFYIVKLGLTGVCIIFLISAQNIDCGYSLDPPAEAVLTSTHNLYFEQKHEKY